MIIEPVTPVNGLIGVGLTIDNIWYVGRVVGATVELHYRLNVVETVTLKRPAAEIRFYPLHPFLLQYCMAISHEAMQYFLTRLIHYGNEYELKHRPQ